MTQFKTLAEARTAYEQLAAEMGDTQKKLANMAELEAQLAESKAFNAATTTENENFRVLIVQKDGDISALQTLNTAAYERISGLESELETLEKGQKTAKLHARELVAASGGAPVAVDQAEISRMQAGNEKEHLAAMAKTSDPAELNRLYREYNKLFRPNGKQKKN